MPQARRGSGRKPLLSPICRPALILSPWQHERNHAGKDFFIIVNRLLTIANGPQPGAYGWRIEPGAAEHNLRTGAIAPAYNDLTTVFFGCLAFTGI